MSGLIAFEVKKLARDRALWALLILVAIVPFVYYQLTYTADLGEFSIEGYQSQISQMEDEFREVIADESPGLQPLREQIRGYERHLRAITSADFQKNDEARMEAMIAFERLKIDEPLDGFSDGQTPESRARRLAQLGALQSAGILRPPGAFAEMPLSLLAGLIPRHGFIRNILYFLFPIMVFVSLFTSPEESDSRQSLNTVPIGNGAIVTVKLLLGWIVSMAGIALVFAPTATRSMVANGFGRLDYPLVGLAPDGGLIHFTVGEQLGKALLLLALGVLFIGALAFLVARFTDNKMFILVALVVLSSLTLFSWLYGSSLGSTLAPWLPFTYLDYNTVMSAPIAIWTMHSLSPIDGATPQRGAIVLAVWSAIAMGAGGAIVARRQRM